MRELTVQVSDNEFDVLVSFLKTLPYVKFSTDLKYTSETDNYGVAESIPVYHRRPMNFKELGLMDDTPFDMDEFTNNYSIQWQHLAELREQFKDAPFDKMIEDLKSDQ